MATHRMSFLLFPRNRYLGATTPRYYFPREREKLAKSLGKGVKVTAHARFYDRSSNAAILNFEVTQGAMGDELPADAARLFTMTLSGQNPTLPWDITNMPAKPDDGTWYVVPTMMLLDIAAKISGGAGEWVEFEMYVVVEYST